MRISDATLRRCASTRISRSGSRPASISCVSPRPRRTAPGCRRCAARSSFQRPRTLPQAPMPPDNAPFDPQRILEVLARHQVQCVVIGGYAAVLAGIDIVTRGIDITPAVEPAHQQRLADALSELHAAIRVRAGEPPVPLPADPRLLARGEIWN